MQEIGIPGLHPLPVGALEVLSYRLAGPGENPEGVSGRPGGRGAVMGDWLGVAIVLGVWMGLQLWVLPRLGVST
jgi:hypothetical protein